MTNRFLSTSGRAAIRALAALTGLLAVMALLSLPAPMQAQDSSPTPTPTSPPLTLGSDYYGINFIQPRQPWLTIGYNSGARFVRWQFNWRDVEPSPGEWTWGQTDDEITAWNLTGFKIDAILHFPPDYAFAYHGSLVPANPDAPWSSSDATFAGFCHEFAARYQGRIASYEVWNEPDLPVFWDASAEQYYKLLKSCYQGIKVADPNATVLMAGMAFTTNKDFLTQVIAAAARDPEGPANNNFFDVMAVHMYNDPELIYKNTLAIRSILTAAGMGDKPIWITETNIGLWGGVNGSPIAPIRGLATPDEAGWYVLQAASNAIAAGAGKLMFFRLADDQMRGEAWGLVANSATPRPSYRALQLASTFLTDITAAKRDVVSGDVVVTDMQRKDGARIVTAYSRDGVAETITVPAETAAGVLINAAGGYSPIEADSSRNYTLSLPAAPGRDFTRPYLYTVGGPVLMLVEADRDPPTATIETVPIPSDKLHVLVRWHGDDGPFGTGVVTYDVEVSSDGVSWQPWQTDTTATEAVFDLSKGGIYGFRVKATDRVGNVGQYSTPAVASLKLTGTLSGQILNLRSEGVPSARIELSDGSLHDADAQGWVHIELPLGTAQVVHIDGGVQGEAGQQPAVPINLAQETTAAWVVTPKNLIVNGDFANGIGGWDISSPDDALWAASSDAQPHSVLRLTGQRRPWGPPAAAISLSIPPEYTAGVLSFTYRLQDPGNTLRLRAISGDEQVTLWQTDTPESQWTRIWIDVGHYAGRSATFRFELWAPKGSDPGSAELDNIILADVPTTAPPQ